MRLGVWIVLVTLALVVNACTTKDPEPSLPQITQLEPSLGAFGMFVEIKGVNFSSLSSTAEVHFNGVKATIREKTDSSLVVDVPSTGTTGVVVIEDGGKSIDGPVFRYLDLYVVGYGWSYNQVPQVVFWHNATFNYWTDGTLGAEPESIVVVGNDVYVAGFENPLGPVDFSPVYWQNGEVHRLEAGALGYAKDIFISGGDVWVVGAVLIGSPFAQAVVWKNSARTLLSSGQYGNEEANAVALSGSTAFVGGRAYESPNAARAALWQNGVPDYLGEPGKASLIVDLEINDGDVFALGFVETLATFQILTVWRNNIPTYISDGSIASTGMDMIVVGSDVLVGGYDWDVMNNKTYAKIWVNQDGYRLTDGNGDYYLTGIAVIDDYIILCGYYGNSPSYPFYAVNNQLVSLPHNGSTRAVDLYVR